MEIMCIWGVIVTKIFFVLIYRCCYCVVSCSNVCFTSCYYRLSSVATTIGMSSCAYYLFISAPCYYDQKIAQGVVDKNS